MNPDLLWLYRLILRWYPKPFRQEFGGQMIQTFLDRSEHDRKSPWVVLAGELIDTATTATTMRSEDPMTRLVATAVGLVGVLGAAVVGGGIAVFALLVLFGATAVLATRGRSRLRRPIEATSRSWKTLVVGGAAVLLPGVGVLATSDDELSQALWSVMAASLIIGVVLMLVGVLLALAPRDAPAGA